MIIIIITQKYYLPVHSRKTRYLSNNATYSRTLKTKFRPPTKKPAGGKCL